MIPILLAVAAAVAPALADVYTIVLPANSPMLTYVPNILENTTAGQWNATYSDANYRAVDPYAPKGEYCTGTSTYWTTGRDGDDAPGVQYSFTGTNIRFLGYWGIPGSLYGEGTSSAGSVDLVIDGTTHTSTGGGDGAADNLVVLAEMALNNTRHEVELVVRSGDVTVVYVEADLDFGDVP